MTKSVIATYVLQTRQQKLIPKDPNLYTKLQKRPHNKVRGIFPKGSLEEMVDSCSEPVLGEDSQRILAHVLCFLCVVCE